MNPGFAVGLSQSRAMRSEMTSSRVQTVCGPIAPEKLGATLVHEHILLDVSCYFHEPDSEHERELARQPVQLNNLSWVRRNYTRNLDNMRYDDEQLAQKETLLFKEAGGGTIVDIGSVGLGRDPEGLRRISQATGLNIVMGSGYYVAPSHPPDMDDRSEADIEAEIMSDLTVGVGATDIRSGIIGELGCSWPIEKNEIKVLNAGARAQAKTGAPLSVHIGRHHDSPLEVAGILRQAGADMAKVTICHLDRDWPDLDTLRKLAAMGCFLEFDMFGQETGEYPYTPIDRLTDWQRADLIRLLADEGLLDHILISHDIAFKHRLESYGGPGYAHILKAGLPLLRRKGLTEEQIHAVLVENPARLLQIETQGSAVSAAGC